MFGIMPMHNANTLPVRGFCGTSVCVLSYLKGAQQTVKTDAATQVQASTDATHFKLAIAHLAGGR